jgi:hypothetical protein
MIALEVWGDGVFKPKTPDNDFGGSGVARSALDSDEGPKVDAVDSLD